MTSQSYVSNNCKAIGIFNYYYMSSNIGAVLMAFALNYFLRDYYKDKYIIKNINYIPESLILDIERMMFQARTQSNEQLVREKFNNFRAKYIPDTKKYVSSSDLIQLNDEFSTFIVGADQVFNGNQNNLSILHANLLQFAHSNKNLIACAASFGDYDFRCDPDMFEFYFNSLSRFDSLSLREKSGVDMCSSVGLDSTHILDPVFYLNIEEYDKLASDTEVNETYKALCYTASDGFWNALQSYASNIAQDGSVLKNIKRIDYHISIESWLYLIKNCEVIVTNSFYAVCFAIIFKKDFICFSAKETGERIEQLLEDLGIQNRMFRNISNQDYMYIIKSSPIDYDDVYSKLQALKEDSINFLINAIETELHNNEKPYYTQQLLDLYQNTYGGIIDNLETILKIKE